MKDFFITSDHALAAVIVASVEANIVGVRKNYSRKVEFLFDRKEVPGELIEAYDRRDIRMEPASFIAIYQYVSFKACQAEKE